MSPQRGEPRGDLSDIPIGKSSDDSRCQTSCECSQGSGRSMRRGAKRIFEQRIRLGRRSPACAQSCHKSAQCNSVTFYSSGWSSHFSSTCEHKGVNLGATSVIFPSGNKPTTPAAELPANSVKISGRACDAAKSGYLDSSPGVLDNLAACAQSCQKSTQCNSVTFYSSKWCSHFSKGCHGLVTDSGATSVKLSK